MLTTVNIILLIIYISIILIASYAFWSVKRANPVFWFLILQGVISLGTLGIIDTRDSTEVLYATLFFLALLGFLVGAFFQHIYLDINKKSEIFFKKPIVEDAPLSRYFIYFLFIFSVVIVYQYYQIIGYNLFFDLVLGNQITDFKTLRLATYSGDNYYAPGYVNQFKNALLPLTTGYILYWFFVTNRKPIFYLSLIPLIIILLYSLLGTGQRAPMLYALVGFLFSVSLLGKVEVKRIIIMVSFIIPLFGLFAVANERMVDITFLDSLLQLIKRIFVNEQQEGILSFKYITTIDHAYFYEWLEGFMGILPNHPGSYLEHQAFYNLHGTDRGTSGVSTIASAYHNGGIFFVPIFYCFLGFLYTGIYSRFLSGPRTIIRSFGYGYLFFILSVYVGGAPVTLLNKGILVFLLILVIRKLRYNKALQKELYTSDTL